MARHYEVQCPECGMRCAAQCGLCGGLLWTEVLEPDGYTIHSLLCGDVTVAGREGGCGSEIIGVICPYCSSEMPFTGVQPRRPSTGGGCLGCSGLLVVGLGTVLGLGALLATRL